MNLSSPKAEEDTPRESSMAWREATYPSRFPAKVATLSMSWGMSISSRNTRNRITVRMARRFERKVFAFSFLIQQNRVRP